MASPQQEVEKGIVWGGNLFAAAFFQPAPAGICSEAVVCRIRPPVAGREDLSVWHCAGRIQQLGLGAEPRGVQ